MAKNVLIRCDASKEIGLGHITRCMVLAKQFRDDGYNVIFAIKNYDLVKQKILEENFKYDVMYDEEFDYFDWISGLVKKYQIDIFVGDIRDGFPIELITYMKSKNILTIAIDEPSDYSKECDLCFYPPHADIDKSQYKGKVYQGLEYVILRPEFYESFEKKKNDIPNVLVMMGGTDVHNLTLNILNQIDNCDKMFNISVLISENHKDLNLIKEISLKSNRRIELYHNVKNMAYFLNGIDYAISCFGTVAYEYINKGIPAAYIYDNKIEKNLQNFFVLNDFAIFDDLDIEKLFQLNFKIINNKKNKINKIIRANYEC